MNTNPPPVNDGDDDVMRHFAEALAMIGETTTPGKPKSMGGLSPRMQTVAKVSGVVAGLVGLPALHGWAFQKVWNEVGRTFFYGPSWFDPRELSFREALALSFAVRVALRAFTPSFNIRNKVNMHTKGA